MSEPVVVTGADLARALAWELNARMRRRERWLIVGCMSWGWVCGFIAASIQWLSR